MPEVLRVTDDSTRDELAEALAHLSKHAKRQQHIVARYVDDEPTAWDKTHGRIDAILADILAAEAKKTLT